MKRSNDIKEYLRSNRKGKAANRLERNALSDPFLYEALEGLSQTPDPIDGLIRLERQINDRAKSQRHMWRWAWGTVASIVVIVGIALWFIWPTGKAGQEVILAQGAQVKPLSEKEGKTMSLEKRAVTVTDTVKSDTNRDKVSLDESLEKERGVKKQILVEKESVIKTEKVDSTPSVKSSNILRNNVKISGKDSIILENIHRFNTYVEKELRYPKEDLKENKEGETRLSFEINSKGVPSRIRIAHGFSYPSNDEIIRLLVNGPRWEAIPGKGRIDVIVRFELGKEGKKNRAILRLAEVN